MIRRGNSVLTKNEEGEVNLFLTQNLLPKAGDYTSGECKCYITRWVCNFVQKKINKWCISTYVQCGKLQACEEWGYSFGREGGRECEAQGRRQWFFLVCREWSKFEEASGRKRNSQDDTLACSKINTEIETAETLKQKAWNVYSLVAIWPDFLNHYLRWCLCKGEGSF